MPATRIPPLRSLGPFLAATAALVVAADRLLSGCSPGWTVGVLLLLGGALVVWRHPALLERGAGRMLLTVLLLTSAATALDTGALAPALGGVLLVALALVGRGVVAVGAPRWLRLIAGTVVGVFARIAADQRLVRAWRQRRAALRRTWRVLAWLAPVAIGAGFAGLFGLANPVLGQWFASAGEWFLERLANLGEPPSALRILLWWGVAVAAWMLLRGRARPPAPPRRAIPAAEVDRTGLVLRTLLVVNAVFAFQVAMDLAYLAGGLRLPHGLTYAEYAHRGAWPLLVAALLSAGLVLAAFRPAGAAERSPWARRLVQLWLAQNVVLTLAALWRLWLYVDAYGLSAWRLAAALWMGLVALGLALIALRIALRLGNRWLVDANALAVAAVLMVCCWLDVGGIVAGHNVQRCREVGGPAVPIDLAYLDGFGVEVAPALDRLAARSRDPAVAARARAMADRRIGEARERLADVRAWTWVRWRVAALDGRPVAPGAGR